MKKLIYLIFPVLLFFAPGPLAALDVPALRGYVNDYADMISPEAEARIVAELKAFEQSDSTQVVILTVPSLEGEVLNEYTIRVAEKWKIGQAGKDNGVIFFVSKNDRSMRIEVGYGLEGVLTDLLTGRIIDNIVRPRFGSGDFDAGFTEGTAAIVKACKGEFTSDSTPSRKGSNNDNPLFMFFFMGIFLLSAVGRILSKPIGSVIGAAAMPFMVYFLLFPIGLSGIIIAIIAGALLPVVAPLLSSGSGLRGGSWSSSSGGGFSGGGFSGGGGSFGGGGSSGGW